MGTKINATTIAQPFREDVKAQILELKKAGIGKSSYLLEYLILDYLLFDIRHPN